MNTLINITENNGIKVVSARELYQFLGYDISNWSSWYQKNIVNNEFAIENEDFTELVVSTRTKDFALKIEFAKKLSMMARTEKGEEAREYFIKCEKTSKLSDNTKQNPSYVIDDPIERAKAWIIEKQQVLLLEEKNQKLQYRSDFVDVCFDADGVFKFDEVAKILKLGYGSITLYEKMREKNLIMKGSTIPYQKYVNNGYFKVVESLIEGTKFNKLISVTYATQKGIGHIKKLLDTK